ncbi:serine/threonine protein kinase [Halalkalibacter alkalisediminis]|uniref:Serine/threonine protein kinase n=1 Tax=Halalkalibacter alkalisediminis TaxID=935616 RepID=A0ABV6NC97_9BACI|nr:serine/threonine protein kinase [Halalkalibacter alkalisediminis]
MSWDHLAEAIKQIEVVANQENEPVTVKRIPNQIECIGIGTDAAVFRSFDEPKLAFKVFTPEKLEKVEIEKKVYSKLGHSHYFPRFYGNGTNYLVISYEEGLTLYECLVRGIHIPEQAIQDVDDARNYAQSRGLNPRDIHLKNILLYKGRAKLLDVSEYLKQGNDYRWDYLRRGYQEYYNMIRGRAIPYWVMEVVRKRFNQSQPSHFHYQDCVEKLSKLL